MTSFSLDLSSLTSYAAEIFNSLSPIVVILGGLILGIGLIGLVFNMIKGMVKFGR